MRGARFNETPVCVTCGEAVCWCDKHRGACPILKKARERYYAQRQAKRIERGRDGGHHGAAPR